MVPLSVTLEGPITLGFPLLRDKNNLEKRPSIFIKSISLSAFQISLLNRVIQVLVSAILVILLNYLSANFYAEEKKKITRCLIPQSLSEVGSPYTDQAVCTCRDPPASASQCGE